MAKNYKKTKVAIVVLTINSLKMVKEELSNILHLDTKDLEVLCVVVDNGSTDGTEKELKNYTLNSIKYKYIQTGKNLGFAGGNNIGIKYALGNGSDYILILNDDMILPNNLLTKLVGFLDNNPKVGIVSPQIYFAKGHEFHKGRYLNKELGKVIWYAGGKIDWDNIYTSHIGVDEVDKGQFNKITKTELASGSCMLVRRNVFEKIGYLDEGLFLYWEDADLSQRAKKAGFEIYYNPVISVWHKVSSSAGGSGSKSNDYFLIRNRYYFAMKYASLRTKFAVLRDTIKLMLLGRDWQKLGAKDALMGKEGAGPWVKN
ncbi:MAG: glycosyltransferase family 2 protein [Patescibacteria group bacterium]